MPAKFDLPLEDTAGDFYRAYSRLEYSLKNKSRHKVDDDPMAHWRDYSSEIHEQLELITTQEFVKAKKVVLKGLPCKKREESGKISPLKKTNETYRLFLQFKSARSTIFRGGTFNAKGLDQEKALPFFKACNVILKAIENISKEAHNSYDPPQALSL